MSRITRSIVLAALIFAAASSTVQAKVTLGISDNKAEMFSDTAFQAISVKDVRIVVPWDGLSYAVDRKNLDAWMKGAKADRANVLLAFDRSRHGRRNPTPGKLSN